MLKMPIYVGMPQMKRLLHLNNKNISWAVWALLPVLLLLALLYSFMFIVPETQMAVITNKSGPEFFNPGLHWKQPLAKVDYFATNQRIQVVANIPTLVGTLSSSYTFNVLWQENAPRQFWQQTADQPDKLATLFNTALRTSLTAAMPASSGQSLSLVLTTALKQNQAIAQAGIEVQQVLLTEQVLSQAALQTTYQNMQGLANKIAEGIIVNGVKQADSVRAEGDQALIRIEGQAASAAASTIGAGQAQAIAINAPLYHQNPQFFKLLMNTKMLLVQRQGN